MIAMGSLALVRGFRLIGFETMADPDTKDVRQLIEQLQLNQQRAFLVVEQYLADKTRQILKPVQQEGGDILMVELPSIHEPDKLNSQLTEKIRQKLGPLVLEKDSS